MRKTLLTGILCLLGLWMAAPALAQSPAYPNTLLWRISGKDLSKPSYLFGTMHLKDRRLFQFSDSLYRSLEQVEGYAMEIDPDEAVSELLKALNDPDTSQYIHQGIDEEEFGKVAKGLERKFGVPAKKITRRQAWLYKQGWGAQSESENGMDAAVDMYLFNIARRQGKWVGGIEDLKDQLSMVDELGGSFDLDDLNDLLEKKASQGSLEQLIRIYTAQNLNEINKWTLQADSVERYRMLTVRNKKMARRIDSLAHIRSHFFAVGAAHLPGSDGLIHLLNEHGYSVEPVFGSKKISPEKYAYKEVALPWFEVSNEEKSYSVQMPGKPTLFTPYGDALKMQVYVDLGTGLGYFATSMVVAEGKSKDSALQQFAKNYTKSGKQAKPTPVHYKGMNGFEAISNTDGYYYRVRLFSKGDQVVMAMVGGQKKNLLYSGEAEKFYLSLEINEYKAPGQSTAGWYTHLDQQKRIRINFPGKSFSNKEMEQQFRQQENSDQWDIYNQTYVDLAGQTYYMLVFKEPRPGNYLQDDALMFEQGKANIQNNSQLELVRYDTGRLHGLPAAWMDAAYKENNLFLKSLHVNRGNRCVSMMVIYDKNTGDTAGAERFFNSFRFLDFEAGDWKEYTDEQKVYTVKAPAPLQSYESGEEDSDEAHTLTSYDAGSGFSFLVQKQALSPYYWTKDDSTFFADMMQTYVSYGDSLLSSHRVSNGTTPGMEGLIRMQENGRNTKRIRFFLNKDTVYTLALIAPPAYQQAEKFDLFFSGFRFRNYVANKDLTKNKAAKLLTDLHSRDSLTFETAKAYIDQAPFTREDLPLLHQALLSPYQDSGSYNSVQGKLMERIIDLKDSSTIAFIRKTYGSDSLGEELRYPLLRVLAGIQTSGSYDALKTLLQQRYPTSGEPAGLAYRLVDSLQLAKRLYPQFLSLSVDSVFSEIVVLVTNRLLDSNLIQLADVVPYKEQILKQARYWFQRWSAGEDDLWRFHTWAGLLGRFNDEASNQLLQQVAGSDNLYIQRIAVVELVKNGQAVKPSILEKIAADDYSRALLYEELKKLNSLKLFPARHLNQKSIARSELVQFLSDEDMSPTETNFLGEKEAVFLGKKQKFYLYKLTFVYEEEKEVYLGVCGPYEPGKKDISTGARVIAVSEEELEARNTDDLFGKILKDQETYFSEQ